MRILLDHCVPKPLRRLLPLHVVKTAREMGWDTLRNGALLAAAATSFDLMLTVDQNIKHQQNVAALPLSVIVLVAQSNTVDDLKVLMPEVEAAIAALTFVLFAVAGLNIFLVLALVAPLSIWLHRRRARASDSDQ